MVRIEEPKPARRPAGERIAQDGGRARFLRLLPPRLKARLLDAIVAKMPASQRDENIFQADVASCQTSQRPLQVLELVQQGGDRPMRLGDGQRVSLVIGPSGQYRVQTRERAGSSGVPSPSIANSTTWSPPSLAINSRGEPSAMILPWSMTATRSQSRSASSM